MPLSPTDGPDDRSLRSALAMAARWVPRRRQEFAAPPPKRAAWIDVPF
ncbi:MAG TPA: hypothetical protein VGA13_07565 [Acidimicrobiales bacterium]